MNRRAAVMGMALTATATASAAQGKPSAQHRIHDPHGASAYCQAHEVSDFKRMLFVSGQIPVDANGKVPAGFKPQARQVWANIEKQLKSAGMSLDDLVKITVFLSDRKYRQENYEVRKEILGDRAPALTIIITGIYDEAWLLEIEAVAAA